MKKILVIGLVLALALTLLLPSVAMAAPSENEVYATGTLSSIDEGNVKQLGNSVNWLVADRNITGICNIDGMESDFTITYGGIFKLADQSGNMRGVLKVIKVNEGKTIECNFTIKGKVSPLGLVDCGGYELPRLEIIGDWVGPEGSDDCGNFAAWMIFIPDEAGHVIDIPSSSFTMTKK